VLGQDTRGVPVSQLAGQVGLVFQNPDHQLFADSVWGEATFAASNLGTLDEATAAHVDEMLGRSGLGDRRDDHPYRLSYGEKRRLNVISILAHGPRLILLDEPLIGQDRDNAEFILGLLRDRVDTRADAVIMVNHDPDATRRYADRVLFFDGGRLVIDAPPQAAFERLRSMGREAYVPRN